MPAMNAEIRIASTRGPTAPAAWSGPPRRARWRALSGALGVMVSFSWGCRATGGDPEFWAPAPGVENGSGSGEATGSGSQAAGSTGADPPPSAGPTLTVDFTTASFNGEYAPDNVGAVWVTDEQDVFVKTLELWAVKRVKYLVKWRAASGDSTIDAVTGATRSHHGPHELVWDMTDVGGKVVPDGVFRVYVEFTEQNGAGVWLARDFVKGAEPVELDPPDLPNFTGQHLTFTP